MEKLYKSHLPPLNSDKPLNINGLSYLEQYLRQHITLIASTFGMIISESMKKYPFKKGVLRTHDNDLSKRWHIEFYVWSETKEKLVRKRWYGDFSKFDTVKARLDYGKESLRELNKLLPYSAVDKMPAKIEYVKKEKPVIKEKVRIIDNLNYVLDLLYDQKGGSYNHYSSTINAFEVYLKSVSKWSRSFDYFTKVDAQEYIDYLSRSISATTIRNKVSHLKSLSNKLLERERVPHNPFIGLSLPKKVQTEKNKAFTPAEILGIKKYCQENDPFMWLVYQFIYYSYMRPIEITRLKIRDIDFVENKINVRGEISKNKKTETIELHPSLKTQLLKYLGDTYQKDQYLFTSAKTPGHKKMGKNQFWTKFNTLRKHVTLDSKCTMYSWKHTGVVNAYKNGVDVKSIQLQCRHSSIQQTDTYLKSLGFIKNDEFLKGIPTI